MKKIIILTAVLLIATAILVVTHPRVEKPISKPIEHKPVPAQETQVTHGLQTPYTECKPNQPTTKQTKLQQEEIASTEAEMAKYNDTPSNTENPELQRLNKLHEQELADYDTCELVN